MCDFARPLNANFSTGTVAHAQAQQQVPMSLPVSLMQDLLVFPQYQRRGIGAALMRAMMERFANVRQFQLLTDDTEKTLAFYRSLGLHDLSSLGCQGFMR